MAVLVSWRGGNIGAMSTLAADWTTPLLEGDLLDGEEFVRRWETMPDVRRAELIDGTVYMPSPVSMDHGDCQTLLTVWLGTYATSTPGCFPNSEVTWIMGANQVPQPDNALLILPEYGGQTGIRGPYRSGAPELIVEVAVSSYTRDFGVKKRLYERSGVREYWIVNARSEQVFAFTLSGQGYAPLPANEDGTLRSRVFPGLWLDCEALWRRDLQRLNSTLQTGLGSAEHSAFVLELAARRQ